MEPSAIKQVTQEVVDQFPEMDGVEPSITLRKEQFTLTYKGRASLPGGKEMSRIVRVVADQAGQVIRMSTSR